MVDGNDGPHPDPLPKGEGTKGRDGGGRFTVGNSGGPGRPKKHKQLDDATLRDLMESAASGPELYLAALGMDDREKWMERIEQNFPRAISDRIKTLVALSDLARGEIVRRMRKVPL